MSDTLARLFATIEARAAADPATSHTAAMLAKGPRKCAEKFGEEAVEAIAAAAAGDRAGLRHEAADVLYHLQVTLKAAGIAWDEVMAELEVAHRAIGACREGEPDDRSVRVNWLTAQRPLSMLATLPVRGNGVRHNPVKTSPAQTSAAGCSAVRAESRDTTRPMSGRRHG